MASQNGHKEIVEILVAAGAALDLAISNGTTPLFIAAHEGYKEIVEILVGAGAKIDVSVQGWTPVAIARQKGHQAIVDFLSNPPSQVIKEGSKLDSLGQLREKLQSLIDDNKKVLQSIESNLQVLSEREQTDLKQFIDLLGYLNPIRLDANDLKTKIEYLEKYFQYLLTLPARIIGLVDAKAKAEAKAKAVVGILKAGAEAKQKAQQEAAEKMAKELAEQKAKAEAETQAKEKIAAEQGRLNELRSKLQVLIDNAKKCYHLVEYSNNLQLFPEQERPGLQKFIGFVNALNPFNLDEAGLTQNIGLISNWQQYLAALPQRTEALIAEKAKTESEQLKLQQETQLRAQLSGQFKSQENIAQQEKANGYYAKAKTAMLAGKYESAVENYQLARDIYKALSSQGIDCQKRLEKIKVQMKEGQAKLSGQSIGVPTGVKQNTPPAPALSPSAGSGNQVLSAGAPVVISDLSPTLGCNLIPFSDLHLEQELGSGGFGVVYKATWRQDAVAVKKLHSAQLTAASSKAFIDEARIMAKLNSQRLVRLYGVVVSPDPYCLVMEYVAKGSLHTLLHSEEKYSWSISLQMAIDVGNGISFLHKENILHRDLKSLNVLIDQNYRAKIADFGLSRVRQEVSTTSVKSGQVVGTNAWIAPEVFGIKPKYSFASDIYAYGIVLWEMLTREAPYKDVLDPNQIQMAVIGGQREEIPDKCPVAYRATIEYCWAQKPEARPTATQVAEDLQQQLVAAQAAAVKSWHIETALKPKGRTSVGYQYIEAGEYDKRKVVEAYMRCPVPGMDIKSVTIIFSPTLNKMFADNLDALEKRAGKPAFQPKWSTDVGKKPQQVTWRAEIDQRFATMTAPYQDTDYPHVKILSVWHGTKRVIVDSIAETGYASLATTDAGFFGKGLYGSYEAKYAYQVYGSGKLGDKGVLLINWISCYSAYPVIDGDMDKLREKGAYANYDAHFIPVKPASAHEEEVNFYPCAPKEPAKYHELVVFEKSQALPRYIVELQRSLPKMPASLPTPPPPAVQSPTAAKAAGNPNGFFAGKQQVQQQQQNPYCHP